jgi:hypothetical protein
MNVLYNKASMIFQDCTGHVSDEERASHLLLTGGKFQIPPEALHVCYAELGRLLHQKDVDMICVTENRTVQFPMYYDIDLKLPLPHLSKEAIRTIVAVIVKQTLRFFPVDTHDRLGYVVVLDKTGKAPMNAETNLYKHGVHVHFPRIIVDLDSALQIRFGVLNGLTSYMGSWEDVLGINPGEAWNTIVDDSVYRGGLRMIGAPKATKCSTCTKGGACKDCKGQNRGYVIDQRVYQFCIVLDAAGERNTEREAVLGKGPVGMIDLLHACTLRAPPKTPLTAGYVIYPGCPRLSVSQLVSLSTGRKRKVMLPSSKRPTERRYRQKITDPKALDIIRKRLHNHHANYDDCLIEALRGGNQILVKLFGDNALYCANKGAFHLRNSVYMIISKNGLFASSTMRCHCNCKTTRGQYNVFCSDYGPSTNKSFDKRDVEVRFVNGAPLGRDTAMAKTDAMMFHNLLDSEMTDSDFLDNPKE